MKYKAKLASSELILLCNHEQQTHIELRCGDQSRPDSEGINFCTGGWTQKPVLFRTDRGAVLKLETHQGPVFFELGNCDIDRLEEPSLKMLAGLKDHEQIELEETDEYPCTARLDAMTSSLFRAEGSAKSQSSKQFETLNA